MSEVNKIVAAILTAGRMPTLNPASGSRESRDWLAEYNMWVETLDKQDRDDPKRRKQAIADALNTAIHRDR